MSYLYNIRTVRAWGSGIEICLHGIYMTLYMVPVAFAWHLYDVVCGSSSIFMVFI